MVTPLGFPRGLKLPQWLYVDYFSFNTQLSKISMFPCFRCNCSISKHLTKPIGLWPPDLLERHSEMRFRKPQVWSVYKLNNMQFSLTNLFSGVIEDIQNNGVFISTSTGRSDKLDLTGSLEIAAKLRVNLGCRQKSPVHI